MKNILVIPITAVFLSITTFNATAILKNTLSLGYAQSEMKLDSKRVTDSPKGVNIKYDYKLDDNWGVIGSFVYNKEKYSFNLNSNKGNIHYDYYLLSVGPSYRLGEYINVYGLIGVSSVKMNLEFDANYQNINFNKVSNSYGVGLQYNPVPNLAIDASYEYSKLSNIEFGTWVVGLGYRF
ncbi:MULTISPECIES: Ail/Lom family outer membrane beta-barrel protein [Gammaproteobacteria]|uniref:Ail/Lom family outer membrane beta-barrel protein n=1 Tax=Gammaproteobacteria TaxID=1236 RepID=UPI0018675DB2|nr:MULTISPECIES: Ail/Lom family outer membrane beta-barrel protein [Gammaproteobacteria]